jgi:hypothetical protein
VVRAASAVLVSEVVEEATHSWSGEVNGNSAQIHEARATEPLEHVADGRGAALLVKAMKARGGPIKGENRECKAAHTLAERSAHAWEYHRNNLGIPPQVVNDEVN